MAITTTRLLAGVKQRITAPANQVLLDDPKILELGSDIITTDITNTLISSKQNYMVKVVDVPLVANQDAYDLPSRSVVGGLRDVKLHFQGSEKLRDLALIDIEDLQLYNPNTSNYPSGFYFRDDQLIVVSTPAGDGGFLRYWFYQALSKLCLESQAGRVTNIAGTTVTLDNLPENFQAGFFTDFVKGRSLSTTLSVDNPITNVAGTQLTFAELPSRLTVGDWVTPAEFTPVLPFPDQLYRYFEGMLGCAILYAVGDFEGKDKLYEEVKEDRKDAQSMIEPRIDGEQDKIVNYGGLLRQKTWRRFGTFRW